MHHNFYGNTTTSASSTAASLAGGATTWSTTTDSSACRTTVGYQRDRAHLRHGPDLLAQAGQDTAAVQTIRSGCPRFGLARLLAVPVGLLSGVVLSCQLGSNHASPCTPGQVRILVQG
jgi:hypothetical protein